jgi:alpha-glucosidase
LAYNSSTRPFLLSRSTFAGSGANMGHWTGDIQSTWHDLKGSIADVLNFQMYGISYSGADICGFVGDATEELCTRWMQLGSFYPFSRNHNSDRSTDQEPYIWQTTAEASRKALAVRYALLPYFYTLFEESSRLGTGVWRPLIFEYPEYASAFAENDLQFLIGSDILVSPVVEEHAVTVDAQFPPGVWYDWYDYNQVLKNNSVFAVTLDAPLTHIPVHIRGGSVIVTKSPKLLVKDTYATPYNIIIALDENKQAYGRVYIDDGYSISPTYKSSVNFIFTGDMLTINGQFDYPDVESIGNITILSDEKFPFLNAMTSGGKELSLTKGVGNSSIIVTDGSIFLDKGFTVKFS